MVKVTDDAKARPQSQLDKFKEAAKRLETDDSEEAFDKTLKQIGATKPPKLVQRNKTR